MDSNSYYPKFFDATADCLFNLNCSTVGFEFGGGTVAVYGKGLPLTFYQF